MGWEPEEVHEHYDAEGNFTGRSVVAREPEWDDEQRAIVFGRIDYDAHVHQRCGNHVGRAMDPSLNRLVDRVEFECLDCQAIDAARRKYHEGRKHTERSCDCDKQTFYIAEYVPRSE